MNRAGSESPALFPFITLRRERFGAIIFNPYLNSELDLDRGEALVAQMCTGAFSTGEIVDACVSQLAVSEDAARAKVEDTIHRLEELCAVRFVKAGPPARPPVADTRRIGGYAWFLSPKSVLWDVTYACNLSCPHCLTDSGHKRARELDTNEALALVARLAGAKVLRLSLVGGEPFLRPDILDIIGCAAASGMRVDLSSNGFHVPEEIIDALDGLPVFQIQISIDGIGEAHDEFRGRAGAFEAACRTLRMLKEHGISTSISATATAKNVDHLGELIELAITLGCDAFKAIPFVPAGRGKSHGEELALGKEGSLKLSRTLMEKSAELAGKITVATEPAFGALLDGGAYTSRSDGPMICSAGYDTLSLGADGTAYPCPFLHDFPLGNLLEIPMDTIWHDSDVLNGLRTLRKSKMEGPCATCGLAATRCAGGCRAAAYLASGSLKGPDPLCFRELLDTSAGH